MILQICMHNRSTGTYFLNDKTELSSFNPNRIVVLICMFLQFMRRKNFLMHKTYFQKTQQILTYVFDWLYFTHCLNSFSSINHLLRLTQYRLHNYFLKIVYFRKYILTIFSLLNYAESNFVILRSNTEKQFHKNKCLQKFLL